MSSTKTLIERFKTPSDWDTVVKDVPIFVEHSVYMLEDGKTKHAVVKGKNAPDGSTFLYEIGPARLKKIFDNAKRNFELDKPIQLFKEHSTFADGRKNPASELIGYHGEPRFGQWNGITAIIADRFVEKGNREKLTRFKEASAEFIRPVDELPAVALLEQGSVPRLPGGIINYEGQDLEIDFVNYDMTLVPPTTGPAADPQGNDMDPTQISICEKIFRFGFQSLPQFQFLDQLFRDAQNPTMPAPAAPGMTAPPSPGGGASGSSASPPPSQQPQERYEMEKIEELTAKLEAESKLNAKLLCDSLERENYEFDRSAFETELVALDGNGRNAACERVRKYHKQKKGTTTPITGKVPNLSGGTGENRELYETPKKVHGPMVAQTQAVLDEKQWTAEKWDAARSIAIERAGAK